MLKPSTSLVRTVSRLRLVPFLAVLLASRLLLLAAVWTVTHGREISNDVAMHMSMIHAPFSVLLYTIPQNQQHPPLLPFMEGLLGFTLQHWLPDFLTIRFVMIPWEVALGWLFYAVLDRLPLTPAQRAWSLAALILLPSGWMTSTVMGQDDSIATCGVLLPLLLYLSGRKRLALLATGIGVVAAKLFVVLDFFVLFSLSKRRALLTNVVLGFLPIVLIYGPMSIDRISHGDDLPLLGFRPNQYFGTNFWIVLHRYANLDLHKYGVYSGMLALGAAFIPAFLILRHRDSTPDARTIVTAMGATFLLFFTLFYHVGPEYFIIAMTLLIPAVQNKGDAACCILISLVPWAGKLFQNAAFMYRANESTGKMVVRDLFQRYFHSSPETWLWIDQIVFTLLTVYTCYRWCSKLQQQLRTSPAVPQIPQQSDLAL